MLRAVPILLILAAACATPPPSEALRAERLRAELSRDPASARGEDAEEQLAELEYQRACRLHTVLAYKRFLEQFPRVPQAEDANARLEALRFNAAKERSTAAGFAQFLAEHPHGAHAAEAKTLHARAELAEAKGPDAEKALRRIAQAEEGTVTGAKAAERLDTADFEKARTAGASALLGYLAAYPAGLHREAAQLQLLSMTLDSLLFAGEVIAAREEAARNPLAQKLTDLEARFDRAERARRALEADVQAARAALPSNYLRSIPDLRRALSAPDPLDRWQAAEELGEHVNPSALDPLLDAIRTGRNPLIRQRAFESLLKLAHNLPKEIADYELTRRAQSIAALGDSAELLVLRGVVAEARGDQVAAAALYQRAFDAASPDPLILRRTVVHRTAQQQPFSSAVAARQLAVWALQAAKENDPAAPGFGALWASRALCAAVEHAKVAEAAITEAKQQATEFPEDLEAFRLTAVEARRLAEARLADAERALHRQDRHALGCDDRRVADRVEESVRLRASALERVRQAVPELASTLLKLASERDPSPQVRARASALLAEQPRG